MTHVSMDIATIATLILAAACSSPGPTPTQDDAVPRTSPARAAATEQPAEPIEASPAEAPATTSAEPARRATPAPDPAAEEAERDARVTAFLDARRNSWRDMNVPHEDGQVLFDLVVQNQYRSILEIGTSTGHSTVWLAWAASKVGGKVVTIEIDERRHREALAHLEAAGLSEFVDARRADAHTLVKELPGPWDLVFSDADKDWYIQYFKDVDKKIAPGGCIAAHNALNGFKGVDRYIRHVRKRADYQTRIDRTSRSGFAISCKRSP